MCWCAVKKLLTHSHSLPRTLSQSPWHGMTVRLPNAAMITVLFTSANEVMMYPLFVCCLYVCYQPRVKTTELRENFTKAVSLDKEDTIKCWKSTSSGSQRSEKWKLQLRRNVRCLSLQMATPPCHHLSWYWNCLMSKTNLYGTKVAKQIRGTVMALNCRR